MWIWPTNSWWARGTWVASRRIIFGPRHSRNSLRDIASNTIGGFDYHWKDQREIRCTAHVVQLAVNRYLKRCLLTIEWIRLEVKCLMDIIRKRPKSATLTRRLYSQAQRLGQEFHWLGTVASSRRAQQIEAQTLRQSYNQSVRLHGRTPK